MTAHWIAEKDPDRIMCIVNEFTFVDPKGRVWSAPANYPVDGASIPRALWTLVGSPYTGHYRRASVVHDRACDDAGQNAGKRREADRMFYHACRTGGCSIREATILYIGVRIGALAKYVPHWRDSIAHDREGPRIDEPPDDNHLRENFRDIANLVIERGLADDPVVIEARTDEAVGRVVSIDVRGK